MTNVIKTVIELAAYNTSVFYQVHNHWESGKKYKYHCSSCKKKGTFSVAPTDKGSTTSLANRITSLNSKGFIDILEYRGSCPLCNAEWTRSQSESEPRSAQKMVFDNGDVLYLFQQVHPTWENAQPVVLQYKLRICGETGRMRVTRNDRTVYDVVIIRDTLSLLRLHFKEIQYTEDYYISRNLRLKDIFSYSRTAEAFFSSIDTNHRRRIYYAYDKHGVKEAYRSILPGGSKWLYALAWANLDLLHMIDPLAKKLGSDQLTGLLKPLPEVKYDQLLKVGSLVGLGLSSIKIGNLIKKGEFASISSWVCNDCHRLYDELRNRTNDTYQLPTYRGLPELHELLVRDINQIEDAQAKTIQLPVTSLEEYHSPTYSVKLAKTAEDLNRLGRVLNICVAAYRSAVLKGGVVIAYVTKGDDMVACLEINPIKASLTQAKLSRNNRVSNEEEVQRSVYLWSKQNGLSSDTFDVDFQLVQQTVKKISVQLIDNSNIDIPELPEDLPF